MTNTPIQFNINSDDTDTPGISALEKARKIANKYNISDMSQDEINVEIAESRKISDWYYFDIKVFITIINIHLVYDNTIPVFRRSTIKFPTF